MSEFDSLPDDLKASLERNQKNAARITREVWKELESEGILDALREATGKGLQTLRDLGISRVPGDDGVVVEWIDICEAIGADPVEMTNLEKIFQAIRAWDWREKRREEIRQDVQEKRGNQVAPLPTPDVNHSGDFHSVVWFGQAYSFTSMQAACVQVMWKNWEDQLRCEHGDNILEQAGSAGSRLRDVFKSKGGMHPAWKTMIVSFGNGDFGLKSEKTQ